MQTITSSPSLATAREVDTAARHVDQNLDLSMIRMKAADPDEGAGFTEQALDAMEREYRRFLTLQILYPGQDIVPCKLVDEMWHRHILDTAAYRTDCEVLFGHFLDHFPYFGMRGQQDARDLDDAYVLTLDRYRAAFGEPPADTWISTEATSRCRTACKPQRCK